MLKTLKLSVANFLNANKLKVGNKLKVFNQNILAEFTVTWMNLEIIILSEVNQKDKYDMI